MLFGGAFGVFIGILIGWSEKANYWLFPIFRFLGPMPTAIWIPISLLILPTLLSPSIAIVAIFMSFPTLLQTSSGIKNVNKKYYEVAKTMGASDLFIIKHIAVPAALLQIFVRIFTGTTTSFIYGKWKNCRRW